MEASPASKPLTAKGVSALDNHQYKAALKQFVAAVQTDAKDNEAMFFLGATLNRLGHYGEAFPVLEKAQSFGSQHPDLAFELGWSLLGQGRFNAAISQFIQYEQVYPGRGQTSEFLGRAYYGLGNYERAEELLKEALRRDPNLSSTVSLYLALVARARGNEDVMEQHLSALLEDTPDSPLAQRLQAKVDLLPEAGKEAERPFRLTVNATGGYNDNVIALGKGVRLPADISDKAAAFFQGSLETSYAWRVAPTDVVIAGYRFFSNVYQELSSFDLIDHFMYVDYRHGFTPNLTGTLRVSDEFTQVGGTNFRNQVGVRPSLVWRVVEGNIVETSYVFFSGDYYFPTTAVLDRDGTTHIIALTDFFRIPGWPMQGRIGYFHLWSEANGPDFDFESDGLVAGLTAYLLPQLTSEVLYARTWDRYDNLNSLSGTGGFAFTRMDNVDRVTAQLTWTIFDWLNATIRYSYFSNDSNIRFFNFDQNSYSGGVTILVR